MGLAIEIVSSEDFEAVIDGVEPERVELLHRCPTHGNPRIIASVTKTGPRSDRYVTS